MTSILDKKFKYTPAASTDIRRTFNRVRKQIAAAQTSTAADCAAPSQEGVGQGGFAPAATPKLAYRRSA